MVVSAVVVLAEAEIEEAAAVFEAAVVFLLAAAVAVEVEEALAVDAEAEEVGSKAAGKLLSNLIVTKVNFLCIFLTFFS